MNETPDLARPTQWAREKLDGHRGRRTWYKVRKDAIKAWRAGKPRPWICRAYAVSRQWLSKWIRRWKNAGGSWASLKDQSSRPHTIHRTRDAHIDAIHQAKLEHPHLGAQKLKHVAQLALSHDTIHRVLAQLGLTKVGKKRRWRKWRRFQRPTPNYLWQCDITELPAEDGTVHVITLLDDCTRFALASRCYAQHLTGGDVIDFVGAAIRQWGRPRQILTDRGVQFHHEQAHNPSPFTLWLHHQDIQHIRARPRHPRTCGKIERWHRSLKEEWCDHHAQPKDLRQTQDLIHAWIEHYNTIRPHWALKNRVPVEAYTMGLSLEDGLSRLVNEVA